MHKIMEGFEKYSKRLEEAIDRGSMKEVCDLGEVVKNLGKVLLIKDELENGMEHQTSQRSYRGMPYYYGNSGVEPGRDEVSYRRGRSRTTGRYVSCAGGSSYGDSEHITSTIEKMMQRVSGEEREVLEKCLDMAEQYA